MPAQPVYTCKITPRTIVAARFGRVGDGLRCESVWERRLRGDVMGGWMSELPQAFASLNAEAQFRGPVRVALAGPLVLTRALGVPLLRGRARERVVRFEAEQALPYPRSDYMWAGGRVARAGDEVLWIAAVRRDVVEAVFLAAEAAHIQVASIESVPLVLARSPEEDRAAPGPRAVVHVDGEGVDIAIVDGTRSVVRSVVLEKPGADLGIGGMASCIDSVATHHARVRQEVSRTLAHHRRNDGAPIALMHVVAPEQGKSNLIASLQVDHGIAVVRPLDVDRGAADDVAGAAETSRALLRMLAETGARGSVNLVPKRMQRRARWRRSRPWLQATAALVSLALAMPLVEARQRLQLVRQELALQERATAGRRESERRWQEERRLVDEARSRVEQLDRLMNARGAWVRMLSELQLITKPGDGIWIESLTPVATQSTAVRPPAERRLFDGAVVAPAEPTDEQVSHEATFLLVACLLDPSSAQAADDQVFRRARAWLDRLGHCPQVIAVEHERFEPDASGLLRVKVVVRFDMAAGSATA